MQAVSLAEAKQLKGGQSDVLTSTVKAKASVPDPVKGLVTLGKNLPNGGKKDSSSRKGK